MADMAGRMGDVENSHDFACIPHRRLDLYRHSWYGVLPEKNTGLLSIYSKLGQMVLHGGCVRKQPNPAATQPNWVLQCI